MEWNTLQWRPECLSNQYTNIKKQVPCDNTIKVGNTKMTHSLFFIETNIVHSSFLESAKANNKNEIRIASFLPLRRIEQVLKSRTLNLIEVNETNEVINMSRLVGFLRANDCVSAFNGWKDWYIYTFNLGCCGTTS
jgi:hypothetical protein